MPGGRPHTYKDRRAEILEYKEIWENYDEANPPQDIRLKGKVIPSIQGLGLFADVPSSTIERWRAEEDMAEFRGILEKILSMQHDILINKGLDGTFNASIAKLALGKHGYKEQSAREHSGGVAVGQAIAKADKEIRG